MKTLEDLTIEDVKTINEAAGCPDEVVEFSIEGNELIITTRCSEMGDSFYTLGFSEGGNAYIDLGCGAEGNARLSYYVEMKRRGFAVPALDEVYGEQDERIEKVEMELEDFLNENNFDSLADAHQLISELKAHVGKLHYLKDNEVEDIDARFEGAMSKLIDLVSYLNGSDEEIEYDYHGAL